MLQLGLTQLWQIEKAMRENRYTVEMFHRMFQKDFFLQAKSVLSGTAIIVPVYQYKKTQESTFSETQENVPHLVGSLKRSGFIDPIRLVAKYRGLLRLRSERVDGKIRDLKERGFDEPVRLIENFPQIFGLTLDNIDRKIRGLKARGFTNPIKTITRFPDRKSVV